MKRVLLINPPGTEQSGYSNPPLGLLYLAGTLLRHGGEVKVIDGCVEGWNSIEQALQDFRPDMVGITCLTPERKKALAAARLVKDFDGGILTVLGGAHPTIMPLQVMENYPFVDCVVLGEGEAAFLDLARGRAASEIAGLLYRENGGVHKTGQRRYEENLDNIPFPAWHLVDIKRYPARGEGVVNGIDLAKEPRVSVIFSRGCSGHCDFCSTWWIWRGWRHRSPGNMADELELLYKDFGVRHFCFADDSMTVDRTSVMGLCDEIVARGLKIAFHVTTRTDCVDETLLSKLKAAGCYNIAFGIETASAALLEKMSKDASVETSEKAILMCKSAGIRVTALIIVGNVGESDDTISDTVAFLRKTRPDEVGCVGGLWILPGTKLYRDCVGRGIINDSFWLGEDPYMVYTAEHTIETLARMRSRVLNYPSFFQRAVSKLKRTLK